MAAKIVELSTAELARALGIHPSTVRRRIARGVVLGRKEKGRWKVAGTIRQAAKGRGVSTSTIYRRAKLFESRMPTPPAKLAGQVNDPDANGFPNTDAMYDWIHTSGQPLMAKWVDELGFPLEAVVAMADAGMPDPAEWSAVTIVPGAGGRADVVITTHDGEVYAMTGHQDWVWDMRRAFASTDIEVEVEPTP